MFLYKVLMILPLVGQVIMSDCQYSCLPNGGCEVQWRGENRPGSTKGSCFPEGSGYGYDDDVYSLVNASEIYYSDEDPDEDPFDDLYGSGGYCFGTPQECQDCNEAISCGSENSTSVEEEEEETPLPSYYCDYKCKSDFLCEVNYVGPLRLGADKGTCFGPNRNGKECSKNPDECRLCNTVLDCGGIGEGWREVQAPKVRSCRSRSYFSEDKDGDFLCSSPEAESGIFQDCPPLADGGYDILEEDGTGRNQLDESVKIFLDNRDPFDKPSCQTKPFDEDQLNFLSKARGFGDRVCSHNKCQDTIYTYKYGFYGGQLNSTHFCLRTGAIAGSSATSPKFSSSVLKTSGLHSKSAKNGRCPVRYCKKQNRCCKLTFMKKRRGVGCPYRC